MSKLKAVNIRYPIKLIEKIDKYKNEQGFTSRTQTIIFLLQYAFEKLEEKEIKKLEKKRK